LQKIENIGLLSLIPKQLDFVSCFEIFRLELLHLEVQGFAWYHPIQKQMMHSKMRIGMVKADTPQRFFNTGHLGIGSNEKCNKCPCSKEQVWDENFQVASWRHRVGILEEVEKIKNSMTPAQFQKHTTELGFSGAKSLFRGLTFCPFRQGPVESYHSILLGEVKLFLAPSLALLDPHQRDHFQIILKQFPFPRGVPKISFG